MSAADPDDRHRHRIALGALPLALGSEKPGREIPIAIIILGGLLTSTALNLLVLPSLALRYGRLGGNTLTNMNITYSQLRCCVCRRSRRSASARRAGSARTLLAPGASSKRCYRPNSRNVNTGCGAAHSRSAMPRIREFDFAHNPKILAQQIHELAQVAHVGRSARAANRS
jgi:hypothetical protein